VDLAIWNVILLYKPAHNLGVVV